MLNLFRNLRGTMRAIILVGLIKLVYYINGFDKETIERLVWRDGHRAAFYDIIKKKAYLFDFVTKKTTELETGLERTNE